MGYFWKKIVQKNFQKSLNQATMYSSNTTTPLPKREMFRLVDSW